MMEKQNCFLTDSLITGCHSKQFLLHSKFSVEIEEEYIRSIFDWIPIIHWFLIPFLRNCIKLSLNINVIPTNFVNNVIFNFEIDIINMSFDVDEMHWILYQFQWWLFFFSSQIWVYFNVQEFVLIDFISFPFFKYVLFFVPKYIVHPIRFVHFI